MNLLEKMTVPQDTTVLPTEWGSVIVDVFIHEDTDEIVVLKTLKDFVSFTCEKGFTVDNIGGDRYLLKPECEFEISDYGEHQYSYVEDGLGLFAERNEIHVLNEEYQYDKAWAVFLETKGFRLLRGYLVLTDEFDVVNNDDINKL